MKEEGKGRERKRWDDGRRDGRGRPGKNWKGRDRIRCCKVGVNAHDVNAHDGGGMAVDGDRSSSRTGKARQGKLPDDDRQTMDWAWDEVRQSAIVLSRCFGFC